MTQYKRQGTRVGAIALFCISLTFGRGKRRFPPLLRNINNLILDDGHYTYHNRNMEEKNKGGRPKAGQEIINTPVAKQIAALAAMGSNANQISKDLNLNYDSVQRALESKQVKELVNEIGDEAVVFAKNYIKRSVAKLAPAMLEALMYQLEKKKSIQAIALGLKVLGVDQFEDGATNQSLTVVLPGQASPVTINAKRENND